MPIPQRLPLVDGDDGEWGDILNQYITKEHVDTGTDSAGNGGHKKITVQAGTTSAGTAPLKFASGSLMTTPEAGAIEFLTDKLYFTQTTSTTRKTIAAYDDSSGATGDMYYRNSSGVFTRLPVGSSGDVLTSGGVGPIPTWAAPAASSPLTTKGDVYTFSSVNARLAVGTNGQVLTADSSQTTGLKWADPGVTVFEYNSGGSQSGNIYNTWSDLVTALNAIGGQKVISFTDPAGDTIPAGTWDLGDTILTSGTPLWLMSPVTLADGCQFTSSWTGKLKSIYVAGQSNSEIMTAGSYFTLDLDGASLVNNGSAPMFEFTDASVYIMLRNYVSISTSPGVIANFSGTTSQVGILAMSGSITVDSASLTGTIDTLFQDSATASYNGGNFPVFSGLTTLSGVTNITESRARLVGYTPTTLTSTNVQDALDELAAGVGGGGVTTVNTLSGDVVLTQDEILDGPTYKQYSATEKTKLSGIATAATANQTDAYLLNRTNHTGTQALSTIAGISASATEINYTTGVTSGIQTQLNAKAADSDTVHKTGTETIAGVKTFSSAPIIPDVAYGAGWDGSAEPATKNAVYDKIETLGSGGGGMTWNTVTGTSQSAAVDNGYIANNAGLVTVTLPAAATVGKTVAIAGQGAGGWKLAQNSGQSIYFGSATTTSGTGGYLASTHRRDCITLVCITTNTEWEVYSSVGSITYV
jgi:hypothetical protein